MRSTGASRSSRKPRRVSRRQPRTRAHSRCGSKPPIRSPRNSKASGCGRRSMPARAASGREGTLRAQLAERTRLQKERTGLARRMQEVEKQVAARPSGYEAARHNAVRAELARLEPVALQAAVLSARAGRAEALV